MVTLQFQRSPFHPIKRTVMVPWNEIIVIQTPIIMSAGSDDIYATEPAALSDAPSSSDLYLNRSSICTAHNYQVMRPLLLNSKGQVSSPEVASGSETQLLQETLAIPGSGVKLVYQSSSSPGYLSTINLQLTNDQMPATLMLIHLRIIVEGNLFVRTFEAERNIKFTYAWNKRNVYRQKVYGLATARGECLYIFYGLFCVTRGHLFCSNLLHEFV